MRRFLEHFRQKFITQPKSVNQKAFFPDSALFLPQSEVVGVSSYQQNVIVNRCVNLIASCASHVPWLVYNSASGKRQLLKGHPVLKLLHKPNAAQGGAEFFTELIAGKLLYGNAYILATHSSSKTMPKELYLLAPQGTDLVLEGDNVKAYRTRLNNREYLYPVHKITRQSQVLHLKNYHPTDKHYGLSCLDSAKSAILLHMAVLKWNNSLLNNGARPSGALVMRDNNSYLTEEQYERLQEQLYSKYRGMENSGKPLLLEGGLDWREMSINPKDMDFIESKNAAAREIALAFGVPPQLLGLNGDNTYSNMQEARLALWEETLLPLLDKLADSLSTWFSNMLNEELIIDFDREHISALTKKREELWDKIAGSNFMTINEKRAFFGLSTIAGGDELIRGKDAD